MKRVRCSMFFRMFIHVTLILSVCNCSNAQTLLQQLRSQPLERLASEAASKGDAVRGALLWPDQKLKCNQCHAAGATGLLGPDLSALDPDKASDVYLVESLLYPSKVLRNGFESSVVLTISGNTYTGRILEESYEQLSLRTAGAPEEILRLQRDEIESVKPSSQSSMPDDIANQLSGPQAFYDLVKYLIQLRDSGADATVSNDNHHVAEALSPELRGHVLIDQYRCGLCHKSLTPGKIPMAADAPDLAWASGRINPRFIERFIADPSQVRKGTAMPNMMGHLSDRDRAAAANQITHFLTAISPRRFANDQRIDQTAAARGKELFESVGCLACHTDIGKHSENHRLVNLNGLAEKYHVTSLSELLEDPLGSRGGGRMPNMQLTHFEAIDIANYLINSSSQSDASWQVDDRLAGLGRQQFQRLGCSQCHRVESLGSSRRNVPLSEADPEKGCLSGETGRWPSYQLTENQRADITAAISERGSRQNPHQKIAFTLSALRCTQCHSRGPLGDRSPEATAHFQTENPNLGPQGRIPPSLTGVGAKLKAKWLRSVLVAGRTIRPYMKTRMPQFRHSDVSHLTELFAAVDSIAPVKDVPIADRKKVRDAGHQLAGSEGLNCIACHTFQLKPALTMPGVDLTEMAERLNKDWFMHFMHAPQRFNPGTVMPTFWPGGRSMRPKILDGDTDRQLAAIWHYLLDGRQARAPRGLIREPMELVADDEAVMLRRSYPGVGKRGIGVGYPAQINLLFDAEQLRTAMLWKGKFADPGGVWRSQGHGQVHPIGRQRIQFAKGPDLDDLQNPWQPPKDKDSDDPLSPNYRPPKHQFKGYELDALRRPAFRYQFENISVVDYCTDQAGGNEDSGTLRRVIRFNAAGARQGLRFRIAGSDKLERAPTGGYQVSDWLVVKVVTEQPVQIESWQGQQTLNVLLDLPQGDSELVVEYTW